MGSQVSSTIRQKIIDAQATTLPVLTRRDVWLPAVKGKATAVIGMRRAGKTSLLWQILADRHASGTPREGLLYFSFEDERLAGMQVQDLDLSSPRHPRIRTSSIGTAPPRTAASPTARSTSRSPRKPRTGSTGRASSTKSRASRTPTRSSR